MKLVIHHNTHFTYSQPLLYTVQTLHLWPVSSVCQTVEFWDIRTPGTLHSQPDAEGNRVHSFSLVARPEQGLRDNSIVAWGTVSTHGVAEFTDTGLLPHPAFYLRSTALAEPHPRLAAWARSVVPSLTATLDAGRLPAVADLVALARAVADRVRYRKGSTNVETTALEAFDWELGVCQDQAHVMVAVCRSIGLPARYVSGYFYAANEPDLASHAWADVCLDPATRRWISLDVTHRCPTDQRHIRLAAATDYTACLPVKGLRRGGGEESMVVDIRIGPWTDADEAGRTQG
ncbi:MAG: transglutaminase [Burkholderiales bacterium RIFCSPHIGHO2_02_FULL_66_10]|jgi:transglutaminase-like putative cysteine protease|uniref:transglutaminase family protein n=1 Tax=Hydrogenophaga sp. TaxID=1904254 RepID=UPI0008AB968C|nr:transglutaminase family protein [Hydrogenophaga sp.]MBU4183988.1 transglutaminase family protein [Gammaproteobacteria bacterium]OGB35539.1 MAG: transglutaminase [Burkholderiales bacterium RIFCSPLOWO2_02_FULL_66_35]OGB37651.1 MAG: transglutaminase [Burkholderiales bacterium RIFCSPHIGHO2_02_FULL_66_10]MBU4283042.1 transglutaminase family protein [Gammaproteobacteria bacterium]MBU4324460.1 transglutaminase family protein [Gammaproteobacteria bacterium]